MYGMSSNLRFAPPRPVALNLWALSMEVRMDYSQHHVVVLMINRQHAIRIMSTGYSDLSQGYSVATNSISSAHIAATSRCNRDQKS